MLRGRFPSRPAIPFNYTLFDRDYVGVAFGFVLWKILNMVAILSALKLKKPTAEVSSVLIGDRITMVFGNINTHLH